MEILLSSIYVLIFCWIINSTPLFNTRGIHRIHLVYLFILKVIVGIALYLIYSYYYTDKSKADIFRYFQDSEALFNLFFTDHKAFWGNLLGISSDFDHGGKYASQMNNWMLPYNNSMYNDNQIIIRINALMRFISFDFFTIHIVLFCFISFSGLYILAKALYAQLQYWKPEIFIGLQIIPSVLFWTSGGLKECIVIFGIGLLLLGLFNKTTPFGLKQIIYILLGLFIIVLTKYYVFIALLPAAVGFVISKNQSNKNTAWIFLGTILFFYTAGITIQYIFPSFNFLKMIAYKQNNFVNLAISENAGSIITTEYLQPTFIDVLKHTPGAVVNSFLRPFPWEIDFNFFRLIPMIENYFFILCLGWFIYVNKKSTNLRITLFCSSFIITLYIIIGLSTPVIGGLVRYKVPALPFLWLLILSFAEYNSTAKTHHQ